LRDDFKIVNSALHCLHVLLSIALADLHDTEQNLARHDLTGCPQFLHGGLCAWDFLLAAVTFPAAEDAQDLHCVDLLSFRTVSDFPHPVQNLLRAYGTSDATETVLYVGNGLVICRFPVQIVYRALYAFAARIESATDRGCALLPGA
jgi:hypothetical protein